MEYLFIIQALWIILPAYVANALAVLVGGGKPIDGGRTWKDGRRLLGDGKTWRGLIVGAFLGMTIGFGLTIAARIINASEYGFLELNTFLGGPGNIFILFSLCFGGLLGDITESFFKRRIGKDRGEDWFVFDQLDFIIGALVLSFFMSYCLQPFFSIHWFFDSISLGHLLTLLIVTPLFHRLANFIFKHIKRRIVPAKI